MENPLDRLIENDRLDKIPYGRYSEYLLMEIIMFEKLLEKIPMEELYKDLFQPGLR